jgi:hypothetical protein
MSGTLELKVGAPLKLTGTLKSGVVANVKEVSSKLATPLDVTKFTASLNTFITANLPAFNAVLAGGITLPILPPQIGMSAGEVLVHDKFLFAAGTPEFTL